jgi:S1-C subfamily serine protease
MDHSACPPVGKSAARGALPLLVAACLSAAAPPAAAAGPEDSVVKVIAVLRYPNPIKPWAKGDPVEAAGTGVVIEGKRILTNAHLVRYATEVSVQERPGADKIEAEVAGAGADVDLAVLTLKDDALFKRRPALPTSTAIPKPQDAVTVYGFPVGGEDLSVTKGVVSRVGFIPYAPLRPGPVIQVSAAVNPASAAFPERKTPDTSSPPRRWSTSWGASRTAARSRSRWRRRGWNTRRWRTTPCGAS